MLSEELYRENYNIVFGYLFRMCRNHSIAEELTAETFLKAFSKFSSYKGGGKISTWLCQIAKNEYLQYIRKQKNTENTDDFENLPDDSSIADIIQDKAMALEIHKLLHNLEEPYKEVFILRVFAELSFRDISVIMEKTETWARVTYYRAKVRILEGLGEKNDK